MKRRQIAAFCLTLTLGACSGSSRLLPAHPFAAPAPQRIALPDAAGQARAVFTILVPPRPSLPADALSPATQSVGIAIASKSRGITHVFFVLTPAQSYCTSTADALECRVSARVPAGDDTFAIDAYSGTSIKSPLLASATVVKTIAAGSSTSLNFSMGGVASVLQIAFADPDPRIGRRAKVRIFITVADAAGYLIVGNYDAPLDLSDSDDSGATKLSASALRSSAAAGRLFLEYTGVKLAKPATVTLSSTNALRKHGTATAAFDPGGRAVLAKPALMRLLVGETAVARLSGPGTKPPYSISLARDRARDPACRRLVTVSGASPRFSIVARRSGACWLTISDRGKHSGSIPVLVSAPAPTSQPSASPSPSPTPGSVGAAPPSVTICPSSGTYACKPDSQNVVLSQTGFDGTFTQSNTCSQSVATVTALAPNTFAVTGGSQTGSCVATFAGAESLQVKVVINVTSGTIIDSRTVPSHIR